MATKNINYNDINTIYLNVHLLLRVVSTILLISLLHANEVKFVV
jgi:hypothetical protein